LTEKYFSRSVRKTWRSDADKIPRQCQEVTTSDKYNVKNAYYLKFPVAPETKVPDLWTQAPHLRFIAFRVEKLTPTDAEVFSSPSFKASPMSFYNEQPITKRCIT
jgi:hypothetical protein